MFLEDSISLVLALHPHWACQSPCLEFFRMELERSLQCRRLDGNSQKHSALGFRAMLRRENEALCRETSRWKTEREGSGPAWVCIVLRSSWVLPCLSWVIWSSFEFYESQFRFRPQLSGWSLSLAAWILSDKQLMREYLPSYRHEIFTGLTLHAWYPSQLKGYEAGGSEALFRSLGCRHEPSTEDQLAWTYHRLSEVWRDPRCHLAVCLGLGPWP